MFAIVMLLFLPLIYHFGVALQPSVKEAQNGQVVVKNENFSQRGILALGGDWTFYWQQLLEPEQALTSFEQASSLNASGGWQSAQSNDSSYAPIGFGTYHLKVELVDPANNLAIFIPQIESAFSFYLDADLVATGGVVSDDEATGRPGYNAKIIHLPQGTTTFSITIQVSNYHSSWGGLWVPPILGDVDAIHKLERDKVALSMFILGALLITATHSLIQFFLRPTDKTPLVFACLCLILFIREFSVEHMYFALSSLGMGFTSVTKLNFFTFYIGIPTALYFVHLSFPKEFDGKINRFFYAISVVFSVYVVLCPTRYIGTSLDIFQFISVAIILYALVNLLVAVRRHQTGANLMLLGCVFASAFVVNDLLNATGIISTGRFFSIGIVGFILCQSYVTNNRFIKLISDNEELTDQLQERNADLEKMSELLETKVEQRTQQLKQANKELMALAEVDQLTNALNRHGLQQYLQVAFERYRRNNELFSIVLLDYDHFKEINDTYGHDVGDIVLVTGASLIQDSIREQDRLARWGGEEFLILLPDTNLGGAHAIADKLKKVIEKHTIGQPEGFQVTVTGGLAEVQVGDTFQCLFKRADAALYKGKKAGRNCVTS